MTTINLIFNDNISVSISSTSFLFKYSDFFKSFDLSDLEEDIYIMCPSNYILDENNNNTCLFDEKEDLFFMFKLQCDAFINMCLFLDIILYDQPTDNNFSKEFIKYVMKNNITYKQTACFMNKEIRSINNYNNDVDIDIQIRTCDINFYELYLKNATNMNVFILVKHKKINKNTIAIMINSLIVKHNRIDIYNAFHNDENNENTFFFDNVHLYNTELSNIIKNSNKYIQYVEELNEKLFKCQNKFQMISLVEKGANLYATNKLGKNLLFYRHDLNTIKYLIENKVPIIQSNHGFTLLHCWCLYNNTYEYINIIKYILEHTNIDINIQDIDGHTALHHAACYNNIETVKLLIKYGANIHLKTNRNKTAYSLGRTEIKQYIKSIDSYYNQYTEPDDNYIDYYNNIFIYF